MGEHRDHGSSKCEACATTYDLSKTYTLVGLCPVCWLGRAAEHPEMGPIVSAVLPDEPR